MKTNYFKRKSLLLLLVLCIGTYVIKGQCNANFTGSTCVNGQMQFVNTSTGTNSTTVYFWNFGNNTTSNLQHPSATYTANGVYTVCLMIYQTSPVTCSSSICQTISVNCATTNPCQANFTNSTCVNGQMQFFNTSAGTNSTTSYFWNFGNNTTSTQQNPVATFTASGVYTVCLDILSPPTCSSSICKTVAVNCATTNPCQANFSNSTCVNGQMQFVNTSAGTNSTTTYFWDFGNSTTSNQQHPVASYAANGVYTVCMSFTTGVPSCMGSICKLITINCASASCAANFSNSTCSNGQVQFLNTSVGTNSTTSYSWNFGNNTTSTQQNPVATYTTNGVYVVCLSIFSAPSCSSTICKTITVNCASSNTCQANFTNSTCVNGQMQFFNTSSGTNSTTTYFWNFGNNTISTQQNPTATYTVNGVYTVCMSYTTASPSCIANICKTVVVNCAPSNTCQANFTNSMCVNGQMQFINTSTGTNSTTIYSWNFGNNTTSNQQNPVGTYSANGVYSVCLSIFTNSCASTICKTVVVNCAPNNTCQANFTNSMCVNGQMQFINTSTGTNSTTIYSWNFGNNTTSNQQNPVATYSANGVYSVCLSIFTNSCASTICKTVVVNCAPGSSCQANFTNSACSNGQVQFINTSITTNSNTSYFWNFGNNTTSTQQNPVATYTANGPYVICLSIFSAPSCSSTICKTITINCNQTSSCQPNFTNSPCINGQVQFSNMSVGTGTNTSYFWNFGNNTTSIQQNPVATYTANGPYVICLSIFSAPSCSATICKTITINCNQTSTCQANFTSSTCVNGQMQFINTSVGSGTNTSYFWSFGNNTTSNQQNPVATYSANGVYTVCLGIVSAPSCSSSICQTVAVNCVPPNGLRELSREHANITISPNPNSGSFDLNVSDLDENVNSLIISVYNVLGEKVYVSEEQVQRGKLNKAMDLTRLPSGSYYMQISSNYRTYSIKTIITK